MGCGIRVKTPGSNPTAGTNHFILSGSCWVQVRPVRRSSTLRRLLNSMTRLPWLLNLRVRGVCPHDGCFRHEASGQRQQTPCLRVAGAKRQSTQLNKCLKPAVALFLIQPQRLSTRELFRTLTLASTQWRPVPRVIERQSVWSVFGHRCRRSRLHSSGYFDASGYFFCLLKRL